jgi:hypothetical protein
MILCANRPSPESSLSWLSFKGLDICDRVYVFVFAELAASYERVGRICLFGFKPILPATDLRGNGNRLSANNAGHSAIALLWVCDHVRPHRREYVRQSPGNIPVASQRSPPGLTALLGAKRTISYRAFRIRTSNLPIAIFPRHLSVGSTSADPALSVLIALMTLLVASLVSFLVFVFLVIPLLTVIPVSRMVGFAIAHTLLVGFVLRIILIVVLEKRSCDSLYRRPARANSHRSREDV